MVDDGVERAPETEIDLSPVIDTKTEVGKSSYQALVLRTQPRL